MDKLGSLILIGLGFIILLILIPILICSLPLALILALIGYIVNFVYKKITGDSLYEQIFD